METSLYIVHLIFTGVFLSAFAQVQGPVSLVCPPGWTLSDVKCFKASSSVVQLTWEGALRVCQQDGAYLADIRDYESNIEIGSFAVSQGFSEFWIGFHRKNIPNNNVSAEWSDRSTGTVYEGFWLDNQPDISQPYCGSLSTKNNEHRWRFRHCDWKQNFICQLPACSTGSFHCSNGHCINTQWLCDGADDCGDMSDERNCNSRCSRYESGTSGQISSPGFSTTYPNNLSCMWTIETPIGTNVRFQLTTFETEFARDEVSFFGGGKTLMKSKLINRISGVLTGVPNVFISQNNFLIIYFNSDATGVLHGFQGNWTTLSQTSNSNGEELMAGEVIRFLTHSLFPQPYLSNQETVWIIKSPLSRDVVTVEKILLNLLEGDTIEVRDGSNVDSKLLATFRSDSGPRYVTSTGDSLYVLFKTGLNVNNDRKGFQFRYSQGCNYVFTESFGIIGWPGYGIVNYPNYQTCSWIINPTQQIATTLIFDSGFNLERNDFLEIYNSEDDSGPAIHRPGLTGSMPTLTPISVPNGLLFLRLKTDSIISQKGFQAKYSPDCPAFNFNDNFQQVFNKYNFGSKFSVSCKPGYSFNTQEHYTNNSVNIECLYGGQWNVRTIPSCEANYCGLPPSVSNAVIVSGTGMVGYGSSVVFSCLNGFLPDNPVTTTCNINGQWENVPTCRALSCTKLPNNVSQLKKVDTVNGDGTTFGSIVTYKCNSGYEIQGTPVSMCYKGSYTFTPPTCQALPCPLPVIPNGVVSLQPGKTVALLGDQLIVNCKNGFRVSGNQNMICGVDQLFSNLMTCNDINECDGSPCGLQQCMNSIGSYMCRCLDGYRDTGTGSCEDIDECQTVNKGGCSQECTNQQGSYQCYCLPGYFLFTSNGEQGYSIPAGETGGKLGDTFYLNHTCLRRTCAPLQVTNGYLTPKQARYMYEDVSTVRCEPGYILQGQSSISCLSNGQWSSVPTCAAAQCNFNIPTGVNVSVPSPINYNQVLTVTCPSTTGVPTYIKTMQCVYDLSSNTYTLSDDLKCRVVDCGPPEITDGLSTPLMVSSSKAGVGSFLFTCDEFYNRDGTSAQGDAIVRCLGDGYWDFGSLRCLSQRCADPGTPLGGNRIAVGYNFNDQATFSCPRDKFQLSNTSPLQCIQDNNTLIWNGTLPSCTDGEKPSFVSCPLTSITLKKYGSVSYTLPVATDNNKALASFTVDIPYFRPGITIANSMSAVYTATDHSGNQATCHIDVNIEDEIAPTIRCPLSTSVNIERMPQTIQWSTADMQELTDNIGIASTVFTPPSLQLTVADVGMVKNVIAVVSDAAGNKATCEFQVSIVGVCLPNYIDLPINGNKVCREKADGTGYSCNITCKPGFYFQSDYMFDIFTTSCNFGGAWTEPEFPHCAASQPVDFNLNTDMFYNTSDLSVLTASCINSYRNEISTRLLNARSHFNTECNNNGVSVSVHNSINITYNQQFQVGFTVIFRSGTSFQDIYTTCVKQVAGAIKAIQSDPNQSLLSNLHTIDVVNCPVITLNFRDVRSKQYCRTKSEVVRSVNNVYVCVPCPAGLFINSSDVCQKCPVNTYQGSSMKTSCNKCPDNTVTVGEGKTSFFDCKAVCNGNLMSATGLSPCSECQGDTYRFNGTYCIPCPDNTKFIGRGKSLYPECINPSCSYIKNDNKQMDKATVLNLTPTTTTLDNCKLTCNTYTVFGPECIGFNYNKTSNQCLLIVDLGTLINNSQIDFYQKSCNHRTDEECFCGTLCLPGTYSFNGHQPDCRKCPVGYFTDQSGLSECLECGLNETTIGVGSTSCVDGVSKLCGLCRNSASCMIVKHVPICQCNPGYTGIYCDTAINYCLSEPCYYSGICSSSSNGFSCNCPTGTSGNRCEVNNNDCNSATCLNQGVCEDRINEFTCHCLTGYSGKRCQIQDPVCNVRPRCENGAKCVAVNQVLRHCVCPPGFTGSTCSVNIDECSSSYCFNGAVCVDGINSFSCSLCPEGYSGQLCNIPDRTCASTDCGSSTKCVDDLTYGLPRCTCRQGFSYGQYCQYELHRSLTATGGDLGLPITNVGADLCMTACESQPNHVACVGFSYNVNSRSCQLLTQSYSTSSLSLSNVYIKQCSHPADDFWTPWYDLDKPANLIESENRTDLINYNIHVCRGTSPAASECRTVGGSIFTSPQCNLHGFTCSNTNCPDVEVRYKCSLARVFKDRKCIQKNLCVDTCDSFHICQIFGDEAVCKCQRGYTGPLCNVDINECTTLQINCNKGTCRNIPGSYVCDCSGGYTGEACQNAPVACDGSNCNPSNTASCINVDRTSYRCECKPGFKGTECNENINTCESNPCLHEQRCDNLINDYRCICSPGWTGQRCDIIINKCQTPLVTCSGRGTCFPLFNDYYCQCNGTSNGKNCEVTDDVCSKVTLCYNSATCNSNNGLPQCTCNQGFMGLSCQIKEDYNCITSSPCVNGGRCSSDSTGFTCLCPPGYGGDTCNIDINECLPNPCSGASTCLNLINSHYCKCSKHTASPDCLKRADLNNDLCFGQSEHGGMARLSYPVTLNSNDGITVVLWVKYVKMRGSGTFFTLLQTVNGDLNEEMATEVLTLDEQGLKLKLSAPETELTYRDLQPNSGRWHVIVLTWRGSNIDVYIDSIRQGQITNYSSSVVATSQIWVSLGSSMNNHIFSGCISQLNIYNRLLDFTTELTQLFNAPNFEYPTGVLQGWKDYRLLGDGRYVRPSGIDKQACPVGYTGFPECAKQVVDKLNPGIDMCPNNIFTTSINGVGQPNWTEPRFSGVSSVTFTKRSGSLFAKGPHTILYEGRDTNNNTALCHFKLYINDEFCPGLPVPKYNGKQVCNNVNTNWRFTSCGIDCQDSKFANNKIGPILYTCSSEGDWIWPQSVEVYPPCGRIIGPTNVDFSIQIKYPIGNTDCLSVKSTLIKKLQAGLNALNTEWNGQLCKEMSCGDVTFNINCGAATTLSFNLKDVKHDLTNNGNSLTSTQVLARAFLDEKQFNFNDIANGNVDPHSLLINMNRICPTGQTVIDNECVTCTRGTFYDSATMSCVECPNGQYQASSGMSSCDTCPPGNTTQNTGSSDVTDCHGNCTSGYKIEGVNCVACLVGEYQPQPHQTKCETCTSGKTTKTTASILNTDCIDFCVSGEELLVGTCTPCIQGYFKDNTVDRLGSCIQCPLDKTTPGIRSTVLTDCSLPNCTAGTFIDIINGVCQPCPLNEYQPDRWKFDCEKCPGQRVTTDVGSHSATLCIVDCVAGQQYNIQSSQCENCSIGYYRDKATESQTTCQLCPGNNITADVGTADVAGCNVVNCSTPGQYRNVDQCTYCPIGKYQDVKWQTSCKDCSPGFTSKTVGAPSSQACYRICPSGEQVDEKTNICEKCLKGSYRNNSLTWTCQLCLAGFTTKGLGAMSQSHCNIPLCTVGNYINNGVCESCPFGTYQSLPEQTNCITCPDNKITLSIGESSVQGCISLCNTGRNNCSQPTTCTDIPGGFECQCRLPYFGTSENCTHACDTNYCLNGATCHRYNVDICYCVNNYVGKRCESRVDAAVGNITDVLIGVIVGAIFFLLLVIACIVFTITRRRRVASKARNGSYPPSTSPPSIFNGSIYGSNAKFMPSQDHITYDPSFYSTGNK